MKIKKSELLKSLTKVLPGIETGNVSIEGADSIVFHKGHIYSYNSAISVDVDCGDLNIEAIVKGQEFYNCIGKLPNEDIDINVTEKALEITDEKIKVQIKLLKQDDAFEKFKTLEPTDDWTDIDGDDFAKALLDRGVHAPTVYFPLIVHEALMIEPTESENLETLDYFCDVMSELHRASYDNPEKLKNAPETTPTARVDDVKAVKYPVLSFKDENKEE